MPLVTRLLKVIGSYLWTCVLYEHLLSSSKRTKQNKQCVCVSLVIF